MARFGRVDMFLQIASLVAKRGTCPRASVGAVIVQENRIVSIGYNGSPPGMPHCDEVGCEPDPIRSGCIRTIHAEANAIAWAARAGVSIAGAEMYCTHSPCYDCAKLMLSAGIRRLSYLHSYRAERLDVLKNGGIRAVSFEPIV